MTWEDDTKRANAIEEAKALTSAALELVEAVNFDSKSTAEEIKERAGRLTQQAKFYSLKYPELNAFMLQDLLRDQH